MGAAKFNRLAFYTHLELMKREILKEGGLRADIIIPVLAQLQKDIDGWTACRRYTRRYDAILAAMGPGYAGPKGL